MVLAGLPVAGILYYVLRLVSAVIPEPVPTEPNVAFLRVLFTALSIAIAVLSGLSLFSYRRRSSLSEELRRKMQGIREMFDCLDEFKEEASSLAAENTPHSKLVEDDTWGKLIGNFQLDILRILIQTLLKADAKGTAMMERVAGEMRIAVSFPPGHIVNPSIKIRLQSNPQDAQWPCEPENGEGVAGYAACRGLPIYVPYTKSNWGLICSPPSQPHLLLQYSEIGPEIWQLPKRRDFKSMISAPAITYVTGVPSRQWKRYGVLNVEGKKRDQFDTDDIHAAAVAARIIAQGLEHTNECEDS